MAKLIIRLLLFIGVGLGIQACGDLSPEDSCNFVRNSDQQRVSWGTGLPVKIYVHESVPSERWDDIKAAVNHWNEVAETAILQIVSFDVSGSLSPKRDGFNLVTWHETWSDASEQARTTINWKGPRVYEGDIMINAQNFIYHDDGHGTQFYDLTSLMIHEFGHLLGLAHNDDIDSVMRPTLGSGVRRGYALDENNNEVTDIKAVDISSMACEYNMK